MLDFACKTITKKDLVKCGFGLNKTEYKIFSFLLKNKKAHSVEDISEKINLTRSSVQKGIKGLFEKDLVIRLQTNLEKGGYVFNYSLKNSEEVKKRMIKNIDNWAERAKKEVKSW